MRCTTMFRTALTALALSTLFGGLAQAGDVHNSLAITGSYSQFDFKTQTQSKQYSKDSGWIKGATIDYTREGVDRFYVNLRANLAGGDLDFSGTSQLNGRPMYKSGAFIYGGEGRVGYTFSPAKLKKMTLTPYAGAGYRSWDRDLGDDTSKTYKWVFGTVGFRADYFATTRLRIGLDIAGRLPLSFQNSVEYITPGATYSSKLSGRPGFLMSLPISYRINKDWSLLASASWERIYISQSHALGPTYEPSSRTDIKGFNLGVQYHF